MPSLSDTDPETERVHLAVLRAAPPERRLRLAFSLSRSVIALARAGFARSAGQATDQEIGLRFVALHYGGDLAAAVQRHLAARHR